MLCKKGVLEISQISQKTSVLESPFNKVAGLQACNFIKKSFENWCFPVKFFKIFTYIHFEEHWRTTAPEAGSYTNNLIT